MGYDSLKAAYLAAKLAVLGAGYSNDLAWQDEVRPEMVTEQTFLNELAFVIFNSGMRASVVRSRWDALRTAFWDFRSAEALVVEREAIRASALALFNSPPKVDAILAAAKRVQDEGWQAVYARLQLHSFEVLPYLRTYPYIGPVIVFHLAKNLGIDVAKPDRHLVRIAEVFGFQDVQEFCRQSALADGDRIATADLVWWRYAATLYPTDYLSRLRSFVRT